MTDEIQTVQMEYAEAMEMLWRQSQTIKRLQQENEKLRVDNDYLRSEKERLGKDVYNLIVKKDEARAEVEKLRERLEKAHSFISRADWMQFFEEEHAFQKESDND